VIITITKPQLDKLGACPDGIAAFCEYFGGDSATVEWTYERQLEVLKSPLRKYFSWAWQSRLLPMWCLRSANLSSADLSSANLSSADLRLADLRSADLRSADLRSANLRLADLRLADLRSANLSSADLRSADLTDARICLCDSTHCASLREVLAQAGWVPGADGRLARKAGE